MKVHLNMGKTGARPKLILALRLREKSFPETVPKSSKLNRLFGVDIDPAIAAVFLLGRLVVQSGHLPVATHRIRNS